MTEHQTQLTERHLSTKTFQRDRMLMRLITYNSIRDERIREVTQSSLLNYS